MAFLGKIKSVFGFTDEDYEIEENELPQRDATVTPLAQRRQNTMPAKDAPVADEAAATADEAAHDNISAEAAGERHCCPEVIFNKVVEIFNESLSPFLRASVDPAKQAKYIHDMLDSSMKEYLEQLDRDADSRMKAKWEDGQHSLRREMESLREKTKKIEDTSAEWKEQKLSAERQKRALSERVHDLEKQIDAFQAEKEQYELENKSLVNKLRAMSIQDGDIDALRNENEALRLEVKTLKENNKGTAVTTPDDATMKQINDLKDRVDDLLAQKENLTRERGVLANDIVVLKKKCEISDAMINDLNHKTSTAKLALAEKEAQYKELSERYEALASASSDSEALETRLQEAVSIVRQKQEEIVAMRENLESAHLELQRVNSELHNESVKVQQLTDDLRAAKEAMGNSQPAAEAHAEELSARDTQIAQLQDALAAAQAELKEAKDEVEESRASLTAFEESLVKIDEINEARQNRIAELQQSLKEKETMLDEAKRQLSETAGLVDGKDREIAALKSTVENNLQLQAASEALLREEIERLRKPADTPRGKRKKTQQISSIDESLDDTNWLVPTPPEGTNARLAGVSDSEFGYQAPQHRDEPNNPAQMLLW